MYRNLEEGLGYIFQNRKLLENALTHSSYANENRERGLPDNERLEFLGDSILGFVVADYLYRRFPEKPEGELTRIRADLVCETNLAKAAETIHLGDFLLLGHGEDHGGGRKRDSIVSDAMESVIAASYMDGGFSAAKEIIDRLFKYYKSEIEADDPTMLEELRQIFEEDTPDYRSYRTITGEIIKSPILSRIDNKIRSHTWEEIRPLLYRAVQKIEVKSINGTSGDSLTYYENERNGISVIAIGGDKLSRGLTLEGLSVSYFLRASKMYDTLMQMGRWFGYRPGYVDLCRLFTSNELNEWYRHITLASDELREEFRYLAESGGTPENYALKVRTHPGQLQITSVSKMRHTKNIQVSWAGRLVETYQLLRDPVSKRNNLKATDSLLSELGAPVMIKSDCLWTGISSDTVCDYLSRFQLPGSLTKVNLDLICDYVRDLNEVGELVSWDIALMSKSIDKDTCVHTFSNGVRVGCFVRQQAEEDGRRLGAGDLAIRLHRAVRITDDVGEVIVRVQTEGVLIGDLDGVVRLGGVMTTVALPLCNVGHVCRHGFSNRRRPTHKRIAAASGGIAIKARRGTALCDFIDLILENFFVINTVGVGHGEHLRMRGLEGNRLTIIRYRLIFISRINRPAANFFIVTFAIVCSRIPLIPSIMIPTGNVLTIRGKFLITGHLGCNR